MRMLRKSMELLNVAVINKTNPDYFCDLYFTETVHDFYRYKFKEMSENQKIPGLWILTCSNTRKISGCRKEMR